MLPLAARPPRQAAALLALIAGCAGGRSAATSRALGARASEPLRETSLPSSSASVNASASAPSSASVMAVPSAKTDAPPRLRALPLVGSCTAPRWPSAADLPVVNDVAYGSDPRQTLDYAEPLPPHRRKAPLVVIVHGGGWTSGRKSMFAPTLRMLAGQGYLAASVEYRLASGPATAFPVPVADVRCATRWLLSHAAALDADPDGVVLLGASAGGQIAALLGAAPDAPELAGKDCSDRGPLPVRGVIAWFGPMELRDSARRYPSRMHAAVAEYFRLPDGSSEFERAAAKATPMTWLDADDAPMLLIHGDADDVVPIDDSRRLDAALASVGVGHRLIEVPGAKHGFPPFAMVPASQIPASCSALAFLAAASSPRHEPPP